MPLNKSQLRKLMLLQLRNNTDHKLDKLIEQQLFALLQTFNPKPSCIGLYMNLPEEPSINITNFSLTYQLALPKIFNAEICYVPYVADILFTKNKFNICEPAEVLSTIIPQIIVLPGLAFNSAGYRLGRGKGFFDKYIAKYEEANIQLIGLCYEFQITKFVDFELHDQPVDYIITEQQIIKVK